jgi:hypothetical protein
MAVAQVVMAAVIILAHRVLGVVVVLEVILEMAATEAVIILEVVMETVVEVAVAAVAPVQEARWVEVLVFMAKALAGLANQVHLRQSAVAEVRAQEDLMAIEPTQRGAFMTPPLVISMLM